MLGIAIQYINIITATLIFKLHTSLTVIKNNTYLIFYLRKKFLSLFIYFERATESEWGRGKGGGGGKRGRERIPSRLHSVSTEPDMGLELTNCEFLT